jgi:uncharacterized protein YbjT (DUF2867 family)
MSKLVVVIGASGQQGGGVIDALLKDSQYKIRGLTRKTTGDKADALRAKGVEVVAADLNSEESLVKAFEGAYAIFAVTPYWESIWTLGRHGAGEEEVEQQKAIAKAANSTSTLKHYLLSTLPPCNKISKGKHEVPHFDYKEKAFDWMRENTPELVAKTTRLWPGWYGNNIINFPVFSFFKVPVVGSYLSVAPAKRDSIIPVVGEIAAGMGAAAAGALARPELSQGKIVTVITEYIPWHELAKTFTRATGKQCGYAELSDEDVTLAWGPLLGDEMASQLRWSEDHPDWTTFFPEETLTLKDLGVEDQTINLEAYMTSVKDKIV